MELTKEKLETIALSVLVSFNKKCHVEMHPERRRYARCTPIDQFATQFLGLDLQYQRLSSDNSIAGLTAYADTAYEYSDGGRTVRVPIKRNQVLLDESLVWVRKGDARWGFRRFTLAHECAHQVLHRLDEAETRRLVRQQYNVRTVFTPAELKELRMQGRWTERQADTLAAALLMPASEMYKELGNRHSKIRSYGDRFTYMDNRVIDDLCNKFEVSRSAMLIRLRELGYMEDLDEKEYRDPLEVY